MQLLVNAFGVFRAFYRGHFSHDFREQGVTLKSRALATKRVFQIYSQLLDIFTRLVLKTTEELYVPSVIMVVCVALTVQNETNKPMIKQNNKFEAVNCYFKYRNSCWTDSSYS